MVFNYNPISAKSQTDQIFIHLNCDDYEPDLMKQNHDGFEIYRVVPPGDVSFFFSKSSYPMRSKEYELLELKDPIEKLVHYSLEYATPIIMHVINKTKAKGAACDYKSPLIHFLVSLVLIILLQKNPQAESNEIYRIHSLKTINYLIIN